MFKILSLIVSPLKTYFINRQKIKALEFEQKQQIVQAKTKASIKIIETDQKNDFSIDFLNQQNKRFTYKDEVITYLFLVPIFSANLVPFFTAFSEIGSFTDLNLYVLNSYNSLNNLPDWYKLIVLLIVIDVLGFRSFFRSFTKKIQNYFNNK
jgi:hypothetical protein